LLLNDGRETFHSVGSGDAFDVLVQVRGLEQARQMVRFGRFPSLDDKGGASDGLEHEVKFMDTEEVPDRSSMGRPLRVFGFTSLPALTRANRTGIDLFVNRRYVEDRSLTHAVVQAYHTLLQVGRFPLAVVNVEIDPSEVDVNVHPQKTQIRFVDERAVFSAVMRAVNEAAVPHAPVPDMTVRKDAEVDAWRIRHDRLLQAGAQAQFNLGTPLPRQPTSLAAQQDLGERLEWAPSSDSESVAGKDAQPVAVATDEIDGDRTPPLTSGGKLPPLRVVGQVGSLYIIAEGPHGVFLIDQHAAHERILYEQFMAKRGGVNPSAIASQQMLDPLTLHVGHEVTGLVSQHLDELNGIGFQIEPFGGDSFLLRGVPAVLSGQDPQRAIEEIVSGLAEHRNLVGEEVEAQLVKMVCKRAAIKAGQQLSELEMRELVRQLEACQSPRTCPHGRPTMIQLSAGELEKAFGRV
jgi:DNA mismatch repair protein MutL